MADPASVIIVGQVCVPQRLYSTQKPHVAFVPSFPYFTGKQPTYMTHVPLGLQIGFFNPAIITAKSHREEPCRAAEISELPGFWVFYFLPKSTPFTS